MSELDEMYFPYLVKLNIPEDAYLDYKIYYSLALIKSNFDGSKRKRYNPVNFKLVMHEIFWYCRMLSENHSARLHIEDYYKINDDGAKLIKNKFRKLMDLSYKPPKLIFSEINEFIVDLFENILSLIKHDIHPDYKKFPAWTQFDDILLDKMKESPLAYPWTMKSYTIFFVGGNSKQFDDLDDTIAYLKMLDENNSLHETIQNVSPPPSLEMPIDKKRLVIKRPIEKSSDTDDFVDEFFLRCAKKFKAECLPEELKKQQVDWEKASTQQLEEVREICSAEIESKRAEALQLFDELEKSKQVNACLVKQLNETREENTKYLDNFLKLKEDARHFEEWRADSDNRIFSLGLELEQERERNKKADSVQVESQTETLEFCVDVTNDPLYIAIKAELEVVKENAKTAAYQFEEQMSDLKKKKGEELERAKERFEQEKAEEIAEEVQRKIRTLQRTLDTKKDEIGAILEQMDLKDKRMKDLEAIKTDLQIQLKNAELQLERRR